MKLVMRMSVEKRARARPANDFNLVPIVASGALDVALRETKAHGLDQVQTGA